MRKEEFLKELRTRLVGLPKDDLDDRINFYSEMIDDRIDEGKLEEEAVNDIGTVDEVVNEIAKETPLVKLVKEKVKPRRSLKAWEIVLIVLGSPLWFPLLLTAFILMFVFYLLLWVLAFVVYVVDLALFVTSIGALIVFFYMLFTSGQFSLLYLGLSLMCIGCGVLMVFACIGATKGTVALSRAMFMGIKKLFMKKGSKE